MPEYRVTINRNRFRVNADNERAALYGLLRRLSEVSTSSEQPILVEEKCGETWKLCWCITNSDALRHALLSAGVAVVQEVWRLDEGRAGLSASIYLDNWRLLESDKENGRGIY